MRRWLNSLAKSALALLLAFLAASLVASLVASPCSGQTKLESKKSPPGDSLAKPGSSERTKPARVSVEQEKTILTFVAEHDSQLYDLLGELKTSKPVAYQKALADLSRATDRLAQIKRNRPHAHELEVKKWQVQSRIQLLTAQLTMAPESETRNKLRKAHEEFAELRLAVLKADREAAAKRLKQLDEQIAAAEANRNSRVQQEFDRSLTAARNARPPKLNGPKKRPASDKAENGESKK